MSEESQNKMQRLQEAQQLLEAFQEQVESLEQRLEELQATEEAIDGLENVSAGDTIWAELGKGVRVKAEIKETDQLLTDVGSDVLREKNRDQAQEVVQEQIDRVKESKSGMEEEIERLQQEVQQIQQQMSQAQ